MTAMRRHGITEGDLLRALVLLPAPRFRPDDAYAVAVDLGMEKHLGNTIWNIIKKRGWIVRTAVPIGRATRRFYWERTAGAPSTDTVAMPPPAIINRNCPGWHDVGCDCQSCAAGHVNCGA